MCRFLCGYKISAPFGKFQGVQLLDCLVGGMFSKKLLNCLPNWLRQSAFPPAVNERSWCFTPSAAFGGVSVPDLDPSHRGGVVSHCFTSRFPKDM